MDPMYAAPAVRLGPITPLPGPFPDPIPLPNHDPEDPAPEPGPLPQPFGPDPGQPIPMT